MHAVSGRILVEDVVLLHFLVFSIDPFHVAHFPLDSFNSACRLAYTNIQIECLARVLA